jgi:hypothetical protein
MLCQFVSDLSLFLKKLIDFGLLVRSIIIDSSKSLSSWQLTIEVLMHTVFGLPYVSPIPPSPGPSNTLGMLRHLLH